MLQETRSELGVDAEHVVKTSGMSDVELKKFMQKNGIVLTVDEARLIEKKLKRDPTLTELHIFNIEWSEHCSYKSSKNILKTLPTKAPNVILGPSEDAGIIEFATVKGEKYCVALRQESHNHPSHIVPYEGAATGIGGIVRDILCMGAKVVGLCDPLRFGEGNQKTKYIANSVIDGIAGYGNAIGVPNLGGDVYFNESFNDNCLVNVACIGIVKEKDIIHSYAPANCAGYDVVLVGKATDNSGFGGASFASLVMDEEAQNKGAVQVPDPFLKNVIIRATYSVFDEVRKRNVPVGFKDCGAGGIMCATSELGAGGNAGVKIEVDKIPVSMDLPPFITACSETQERLIWIVPKSFTNTVLRIYNEDFELPDVAEGAQATLIGEMIEEQNYILTHEGKVICNSPIQEVTEGITYNREVKETRKIFQEPSLEEPNYKKIFLEVLHHPNVANKAKAYKHYDTEVQGMAVIRPGEADAGVIKPLPDSNAGLAVSSDSNPMYGRIDPYWGAVNSVAECMRNLAAVGATPAGITNCLNFGSPEKPEVLWEFKEAVRGLGDACTKLSHKVHKGPVPIVSGNVSFYNENKTGSAVDPSAMITCVGILDDYTKAITMQVKKVGSELCMIGRRKDELGGSVYYQLHKETGKNVPKVDFERSKKEIHAVIDMINNGLVLSCHDISDGGMITTIAEMLLGTEGTGKKGANISLQDELRADVSLFSETGGFILEIDKGNLSQCKEIYPELTHIGRTNEENILKIAHNGEEKINVSLEDMGKAWMTGFEEALQ